MSIPSRLPRLSCQLPLRPREHHIVRRFSQQTSALDIDNPPSQNQSFVECKRVFSAIQPTGVPHLGNYLGTLRKWKELQDEKAKGRCQRHQLWFAVADLHALTANQDPVQFLKNRNDSYASLLAIGLDPNHCHLFMQSDVPSHSELMWIFSTIASTGYLSRMTQWKSKLQLGDHASLDDPKTREQLKLGLFSYPVLQAADILLYHPDSVPVGEDQLQHVEFARTLAKAFNAHYCQLLKGDEYFKPPEAMVSPARRVMSLRNPAQKMSKSDPNVMSRVLITDPPEEIHNKLRRAVTDSIEGISYEPDFRPGVSNLVSIIKYVTNTEVSLEDIADDNKDHSMKAFKEHVADIIIKELDGIRDRFLELSSNAESEEIQTARESGTAAARSTAKRTIDQVHRLLGLDTMRSVQGMRKVRRNQLTKQSHNKRTEDYKARIRWREHQKSTHEPHFVDDPIRSNSNETKTEMIREEQRQLEAEAVEEPVILPQKDQGVDRPIAS